MAECAFKLFVSILALVSSLLLPSGASISTQFNNPLGRPAIVCVIPDKGFTDRRDVSGGGNELFNGTYEIPEVFAANDDRLGGYAVDFANSLFGLQLGWEHEFRQYPTYPSLLYAARIERCDLAMGPFIMTTARAQCTNECRMYNSSAAKNDSAFTSSHGEAGCCVDFSIPYIRSGIAIMKKIEIQSPLQQLKIALTKPFVMSCLCVLVIGMIVVGCFIYVYENWMMTGAFHEHWQDGIQEGVWLTVVTTTTVGYGDFAPRSALGRAVMAVWMFFGFVALAGVLGAIVDALGTAVMLDESLANADANGMRGSSICTYPPYVNRLLSYGFEINPAEGAEDFSMCLDLLRNGKIDAVAYDEPALQAIRKTDPDFKSFAIGSNYIDFDMVAVTSRNSVIKDALNVATVTILNDQDWVDRRTTTHFGDRKPPAMLNRDKVPWALIASTISVIVVFGVLQYWPVPLEKRHPDKVRRLLSRASLLNKRKESVNEFFKQGDLQGNGDGMLSLGEAQSLGMDMPTFSEIDVDGNGFLTKDEFTLWQEREQSNLADDAPSQNLQQIAFL